MNPLFSAIQYRRISTVKLLLEKGANPNIEHPEMHAFPLHLACSNDFVDIVVLSYLEIHFSQFQDLLIEHNVNVDCEDRRGYPPPRAPISHFLPVAGSHLWLTIRYTPLLMAATEGYNTTVNHLIAAGADVNHRSHVRFNFSSFFVTYCSFCSRTMPPLSSTPLERIASGSPELFWSTVRILWILVTKTTIPWPRLAVRKGDIRWLICWILSL